MEIFLAGIFKESVRYKHYSKQSHFVNLHYIFDFGSCQEPFGIHSRDIFVLQMNWHLKTAVMSNSQHSTLRSKMSSTGANKDPCCYKRVKEGLHTTLEINNIQNIWSVTVFQAVFSVQTEVVKIITTNKIEPVPLNTSYIKWQLDLHMMSTLKPYFWRDKSKLLTDRSK